MSQVKSVSEIPNAISFHPADQNESEETISYFKDLRSIVAQYMILNRIDASEMSRSSRKTEREYDSKSDIIAGSIESASTKKTVIGLARFAGGLLVNLGIPNNNNTLWIRGYETTNGSVRKVSNIFLNHTFSAFGEMWTTNNTVTDRRATAAQTFLSTKMQENATRKQATSQANSDAVEALKTASQGKAKAASGAGG